MAKKEKDIVIYSEEVFRDGGTVEIKTNIGSFFIDGRLRTKSRKRVFDRYPGDKNAQEISPELFSKIRTAMRLKNQALIEETIQGMDLIG